MTTEPDEAPDVLWCRNDEPHRAHSRGNRWGDTDYCSGRPTLPVEDLPMSTAYHRNQPDLRTMLEVSTGHIDALIADLARATGRTEQTIRSDHRIPTRP